MTSLWRWRWPRCPNCGFGRDHSSIDTSPDIRREGLGVGIDQLVFSVQKIDLSLERVGRHLVIEHADSPVARLLGVSSISLNQDAIFGDFSGI